ncbi:Proton-coupled folate transporter [Folsomia candida]|uniref:Proton-coupled folate transporter n=2 Tax=Folsomia candida TaxID=158441 RepID=A0A226F489_FOLCA|nr:Proton-coupled folate transporter [Folsomia candida]
MYICIMSWIISTLKSTSVEPSAFLLLISVVMTGMLCFNLQIESTCMVYLNETEAVCKEVVNANSTFSSEEVEVQKVVADAQIYSYIVENILRLFYILVAGAYSERYGRKGVMTLSLFGACLRGFAMMIASRYYATLGPYWIGYIDASTGNIFGKETGFTMAAYSYICDMTEESTRTFRIAMLGASCHFGIALGYLIAGMVINAGLSSEMSFLISILISVMAWILLICCGNVNSRRQSREDFLNQKEHPGLVKSIISPIVYPFGKDLKHRRMYVFWIFITYVCTIAPFHGESSILYLFSRRLLGWDATQYGYFCIYGMALRVSGVLLSMVILSHVWKLRDPVIGFISCLSQISGHVMYMIATNAVTMFLAPAVGLMTETTHVISRSLLSKSVPKADVGKVIGLMSILDIIAPLVVIPIYNLIYKNTLTTFPGGAFLFSVGITLPAMAIFFFMLCKPSWWTKRGQPNMDIERIPILQE